MTYSGSKNALQINPFLGREQPMFAEVMAQISSDKALSATKRRDVVSSIRCLMRLLDLDPTRTPASLGAIRERMAGLHPAQADMSQKRFANIKADVGFALRHLGLTKSRRINGQPLSPAWQALWEAIEDDQTRWKLSRLFHYCSALGIAPEEVDDGTIEDLHGALIEESFVKGPEETVRMTIYAWNRAGRETTDWPGQALSRLPDRRNGWTIPLQTFPESFQKDVNLWLRHLSGDDPLADDAVPRPLRLATLDHRAFQVRMFASALVHRNVPVERIAGLETLVEVENFKEALRFMLDRHGGDLTESIYNCATAIKAVAKHHVKVSPEHLEQLKRICARIKVKNRGLTEKNRRRLRQFDDSLNVSALMHLPGRLEGLAKRGRGRKAVVIMQMAVAVELLTMAPIRIGNLAALKLGETLFWTRPGRQGRLLMSIPEHDVKNGRPIDFELPEETANLIKRYLILRVLLFADPGEWLFPGLGGRAKRPETLSVQIKKTIYDHTGLIVNVHLMRHIAAKIFLERHPGSLEVVRRALGHSSSDTTIRHYAGFENKAALRHYDEVILEERRKPFPGKVRVTGRKKP